MGLEIVTIKKILLYRLKALMMNRNFLLLILISIMIGCSQKQPNTWQERIVETHQEALSLAYSEYGNENGKTLLFLHGFGESQKTWRFLVPQLAKKYHLVLVDLKGFGESPKIKDDAYSVYDHAKIVAKFMEQKGLKNVNIVAHSLGGGVALVLGLMQRDALLASKTIESLVLINSTAYKQALPSMLKTLNQPMIGFLAIHFASNEYMAEEGYRYAFYNDDLIPKESVMYTSQCLGYPLAKYAYLQSVEQLVPDDITTIEKRYREILLRTLILWGREDVSIHIYQANKLHRALRNSRLKVFSKVGHMPQEESPRKVIEEIVKFMEEKP